MTFNEKVARCRGRIAANAGVDNTIPPDIMSDMEKKAFLAGYAKEMRYPSIDKELSNYPTQLSKRAVLQYEEDLKNGTEVLPW